MSYKKSHKKTLPKCYIKNSNFKSVNTMKKNIITILHKIHQMDMEDRVEQNLEN